MKGKPLDDFADLSGWTPVASGQAQLDISRDRGPGGGAMRLDFDFKGGGGFVVARKRFSFPLPEAYAFTFDVRGMAPANKLEFKLVDPGGQNVWRYQENAFDLPADWRSLRIGSSQIDFAWGPAGSGPMHQVGAIEFAVTAPPGGKGTLWLANLCLEDHTFRSTPAVQASSALPGHEPRYAVDRRVETSWRSEPSDEPQWFLVDFGEVREYGGLIVRWDATTTARPFDLETSDDGAAWKTVYSAGRPDAARSYVYLPHGTSRQLRLRLRRGADGKGIGIAEIDVRPYEFSRSLSAFFQNIAANEPRRVRFFAALRPFQVTPPWQAFNDLGGVSRITTLEYATGAVWVNRRKAVIPLTAPSGFGVAALEQAAVTEYLLSGDLPAEDAVSDGFGYASGALRYDLDLRPGSARDVYLATPFGAADPALAPSSRGVDGAEQFDLAVREWSAKLGRVDIRLPATARAFSDTFRTAAAHILINRHGPAFQPRPRRYVAPS